MTHRTTVGLTGKTKARLEEYKFQARCKSFNEAVETLLEQAEIDVSN